MKLLSFNVRGIGSRRKRKLVKDLIANTKVDFVCIQETKLDIIPISVCESLWVDKNFDWVYSGSIGSAGGLLCIWDKRKFVRDDCCSDEGFLSVSGFWESSKDIMRIVNIYAPCHFARLNRWDNKFLSFGGRIILIKSVLSNLPTYALSYNRAPSTIINKLTSLQRRFLWGGGVGSERKIAWVSWEAICRENCSGGLGIKNLEWFNLALFGKWGWRVIGREGSLLSNVIESKYGSFWDCIEEFKSGNFNASNWSFWWSSLVKFVGCSTWFSSNCIRVIKNGKSSKFWSDKWVGGSSLKELFPRLFRIESESECLICERVIWEGSNWNMNWKWRRRLFVWEDNLINELKALIDRFLSYSEEEDYWSWSPAHNGLYSVKSAYKAIEDSNTILSPQGNILGGIWSKMVPLKVSAFSWRMVQDKVPSILNLQQRGAFIPSFSTSCRLCGSADEGTDHLFFECRHSRLTWGKIYSWFGIENPVAGTKLVHFKNHCEKVEAKYKSVWALIWHCTVWNIWSWRNRLIFEGVHHDEEEVVFKIQQSSFFWLRSFEKLSSIYSFSDWLREPLLLL
ncbi:hypothetical protein ACS0TY_025650 [Phlomoides rotata]